MNTQHNVKIKPLTNKDKGHYNLNNYHKTNKTEIMLQTYFLAHQWKCETAMNGDGEWLYGDW